MTGGVWETDYHHDRRKHRHRCVVCARILDDGDRVLMARLAKSGKCKAIHLMHADAPWDDSPDWTWRKSFHAWAEPQP